MNENEFRTRYAASQSHVEASPELKQRAVCNALQEGAAQHAGSQAVSYTHLTLPTKA